MIKRLYRAPPAQPLFDEPYDNRGIVANYKAQLREREWAPSAKTAEGALLFAIKVPPGIASFCEKPLDSLKTSGVN